MSEKLNREWEKKSEEIAVLEGRIKPKREWNRWVVFIVWCIIFMPIQIGCRVSVIYLTGNKLLGFICQLIVALVIGLILGPKIRPKK